MEINITPLAQSYAPDFSASRMELGQNAGQITWQANLADASDRQPPLLDTEEKREAFRDFVGESGGWTREEIASWTDTELNALLHQWIMGDIREAPSTLPGITFVERDGQWWHESEETPDFETGPFVDRSEAYHDACPGHGYPSAECLADIDWLEYRAQSEAGRVSSRIFKSGDEYFFYIGN